MTASSKLLKHSGELHWTTVLLVVFKGVSNGLTVTVTQTCTHVRALSHTHTHTHTHIHIHTDSIDRQTNTLTLNPIAIKLLKPVASVIVGISFCKQRVGQARLAANGRRLRISNSGRAAPHTKTKDSWSRSRPLQTWR